MEQLLLKVGNTGFEAEDRPVHTEEYEDTTVTDTDANSTTPARAWTSHDAPTDGETIEGVGS